MATAADYVACGLALVPIPTGRKGPNSKGWNKPEKAITDPHRASALRGNIGLAHAYSNPLTMALDIDDLPKARVWLSERGVDLDALLDADDAVQVYSGREGRAKLFYRQPPDVGPIMTKQITDPETGEMVLEFRCASAGGLTVQDVLPPSIHPETGQPYKWAGKGNWQDIPQIPKQLLGVWQEQLMPTVKRLSSAVVVGDDSSVATVSPETIRDLRSALFSMRADEYDLWVKVGLALRPLGDVGRGLWMEWSLTSGKSLDGGPLEASQKWDSFKPSNIDYRFVFGEAQRRGWINPAKSYTSPQAVGADDGDWGTPQPLPNLLRKVKDLDLDCLPSTIRDAVADMAERLWCPVDYVATSLLVGAGAIAGNRIGILPKQHDDSWEVYPALWGGIVGPPGSMKTPVQQATMKPLLHIEQQEGIAYAAALTAYQATRKQYEKDLAAFKAGSLSMPPAEPQEPKKPRLIVNDTTYQALGEILAANPRGILVHGDELSGLLQSLDTAGQEAARGFYLAGWGGSGNYSFDRIARGNIRLTHFALSVFGGFQPDKIKHYVRMAQSGSTHNDGLLQRFQLLVWPDLSEDFVLVDRPPNRAALDAMNAAMLGLRDGGEAGQRNQHGSRLFHFDGDAQALFNQWYTANETLLRRENLGPSEQSHFAKYRSLVPALALVFHLLEGHEGPVCAECLTGAVNYAAYLKSHAQRVYGAVHGGDGASTHALAGMLKRGKLSSGFTVRSVYTKGWRELADKGKAQQAVDQLVELGWLKERLVETGGRPTTGYDINPRILKQ